MKNLLLTTIAAVVLVGCGQQPPDISIHDAANEGNIEAVKQHLVASTDVELKDDDGMTPLHHAARAAQSAIVKLLVDKGANVNAIDNVSRFTLSLSATPRIG